MGQRQTSLIHLGPRNRSVRLGNHAWNLCMSEWSFFKKVGSQSSREEPFQYCCHGCRTASCDNNLERYNWLSTEARFDE